MNSENRIDVNKIIAHKKSQSAAVFAPPLIEAKGVALGYEGNAILKNINFSVHQGDYLCIVGENGAGKSTMIKGLLKLLKPMEGTITYGTGLADNEVGYLPQQTDTQKDFPASVYEVVLSGRINALKLRPFYSKEDKKIAEEKMELLGITKLKKACYQELSGGQQQRVLLARALCATKKVLLLDEPVAGLDPRVTGELYELIRTLNSEHGITIIMVSHDMQAAMKYSSHILHLSHKQLYFGKTDDYTDSDAGKIFIHSY